MKDTKMTTYEDGVCFSLVKYTEAMHRCVKNSVQNIPENIDELDLQKYHDILEEVMYLRSELIQGLNHVGDSLERIQASKQPAATNFTVSNIESDIDQKLVLEKEESGRQEEEQKQD